ncbi:MAG: serine protease [Planctomycetota bacterium]
MVKRFVVYGLLVIAIICTAETQSPQREVKEITISLDKVSYTPYQDEYEKLLYPTVRITTGFGTGSGVIFNHKDTKNTIYILTACHVVDKQSVVNIELYDSTVITASVVITDTTKDLALLKSSNIQHLISNIYSARLAPRDYTPYLFAPVWVVGCSLGLDPRPSYGHITAINEQLAINNAQFSLLTAQCPFWEISSPILPGNSGGPVYDARTFEVIGIAVWVKVYQFQLVTTMAGIVPINQIYEFLNHKEHQEHKE